MEVNSTVESVTVKNLSIGEKLKYFFTNPNKIFEDYNTRPTWKLKFLIIIAIATAYSVLEKILTFGSQIDIMLQQMPDMPKEQAQMIVQFMNSPWMTAIYAVMYILIVIGAVLLTTLIYKGLISLFGGKTTYKKLLSVYSLAYIPYCIGSLVSLAIGYFTNNYENILNPDALNILLSRLDLFVICQALLLVFGFSKVAELKLKKSAIIVAIMWLAATGISVISKLL